VSDRDKLQQRFAADFEYPVVFTRDGFHPGNEALVDALDRLREDRPHRTLVFLDAGLVSHQPDLPDRVRAYFDAHPSTLELAMPPRVVPGGEPIKNDYRLTMEIVDTILECRMCRQSVVAAVGGGAVLDAVGFAASIVHRGLRMVRLPTTVLAQNDAGIGVKTGMNLHGGKNTVGTFAPPFAVVNDFAFLATLPDRAWREGIAEAFKVAIIKDKHFFDFLRARAATLKARDEQAMDELIRRCAALHLDHIRGSGDPFEQGRARPLDFGHWSAHRLESMSGYRISHGAAVAVGIALDTFYAAAKGWISRAERDAVHQGLQQSGLELAYPELERRLGDGTLEILQGLEDFREHLGGELTITFPRGLGHAMETHQVDPAIVEAGVRYLLTTAQAAPRIS